MITTFLIVLGVLALLGGGSADVGDACLITLLLKILPLLLIFGGILTLVMCSH